VPIEYTPHDDDVTCSGLSPRTGKIITSVFLKEDKICYKMVYSSLHLP